MSPANNSEEYMVCWLLLLEQRCSTGEGKQGRNKAVLLPPDGKVRTQPSLL